MLVAIQTPHGFDVIETAHLDPCIKTILEGDALHTPTRFLKPGEDPGPMPGITTYLLTDALVRWKEIYIPYYRCLNIAQQSSVVDRSGKLLVRTNVTTPPVRKT